VSMLYAFTKSALSTLFSLIHLSSLLFILSLHPPVSSKHLKEVYDPLTYITVIPHSSVASLILLSEYLYVYSWALLKSLFPV